MPKGSNAAAVSGRAEAIEPHAATGHDLQMLTSEAGALGHEAAAERAMPQLRLHRIRAGAGLPLRPWIESARRGTGATRPTSTVVARSSWRSVLAFGDPPHFPRITRWTVALSWWQPRRGRLFPQSFGGKTLASCPFQ